MGARVKDPDSCNADPDPAFFKSWVRDPDSVAHFGKNFVKSSYFTTISNC